MFYRTWMTWWPGWSGRQPVQMARSEQTVQKKLQLLSGWLGQSSKKFFSSSGCSQAGGTRSASARAMALMLGMLATSCRSESETRLTKRNQYTAARMYTTGATKRLEMQRMKTKSCVYIIVEEDGGGLVGIWRLTRQKIQNLICQRE